MATTGEQFEEALGLLLSYERALPLLERFVGLGGPQPGAVMANVQEAAQYSRRRLSTVKKVVNESLYRAFGLDQVDEGKAVSAYSILLGVLEPSELVIATTNYDRSTEIALAELGHQVNTGFPQRAQRTPRMNMAGAFNRRGASTLVLHLHGAVGWYEVGGGVEDHHADQQFNSSLGRPLVLYPDPAKDPMADALVAQIWNELDQAISWADHILVLGHSLHDAPLVSRLSVAAQNSKIAVSYFSKADKTQVSERLGSLVTPVQLDFGPDPNLDVDFFEAWRAS